MTDYWYEGCVDHPNSGIFQTENEDSLVLKVEPTWASIGGVALTPNYMSINTPITKPDTVTLDELSVAFYYTVVISPVQIDPKKFI